MAIALRFATNDDIPPMAAIRAQEWETQSYWMDRIRLYLNGDSSPQQALPSRAVFVMVENDVVVGFAAGHRTRRHHCDGELQWINVDNQKRGRGIGAKLLTAIGEWFVQQGARRICVDVNPNNAVARRLYTSHGARPLNNYWMVWEDVRSMAAGRENS